MKYSSFSKINLNLCITGLQKDKYHTLESIFIPLSLPKDILDFEEGKAKGIKVFCNRQDIDLHNNTLTKAYNLFSDNTGFTPGLEVYLEKNIPLGAGLGGGSGNGALMLRYLYHRYFNTEFMPEKNIEKAEFDFLLPLARKIGADVPFFLLNKAVKAKGIGDILEEIDISFLKNVFLVLVCPQIFSDTTKAYKEFDKQNKEDSFFLKIIASESLTMGRNTAIKPFDVSANMFVLNDLEKAVFSIIPKLNALKAKCFELGANACAMSGSGSSLFALFRQSTEAEKACSVLKKEGIKTYSLLIT